MLKVFDTAIVFAEIPEQVSLALNISECPGNCGHFENGEFILDCSEPWLLKSVGEELTKSKLDELIEDNKDITCVAFMGGDNDHNAIYDLSLYIHEKYPALKVAMYSGREFIDTKLASVLDYYKIGRFIMPQGDPKDWWKKNCGVLQFPFSNQLMFQNIGGRLYNITYKFREKPLGNLESYIVRPEDNKD